MCFEWCQAWELKSSGVNRDNSLNTHAICRSPIPSMAQCRSGTREGKNLQVVAGTDGGHGGEDKKRQALTWRVGWPLPTDYQ